MTRAEIRAAIDAWARAQLANAERSVEGISDYIERGDADPASVLPDEHEWTPADWPGFLRGEFARCRANAEDQARQIRDALEAPAVRDAPWRVWDRLVGAEHRAHFPDGWRAILTDPQAAEARIAGQVTLVDARVFGDAAPRDGRGMSRALLLARDAAIRDLVLLLRRWVERVRDRGETPGNGLAPLTEWLAGDAGPIWGERRELVALLMSRFEVSEAAARKVIARTWSNGVMSDRVASAGLAVAVAEALLKQLDRGAPRARMIANICPRVTG